MARIGRRHPGHVFLAKAGSSTANFIAAAADTLGTTDTATRVVQVFTRTATDVLGTTDVAVKTAGLLRTSADILATTDAATRGSVVFARTASEALGTNDTALRAVILSRTSADVLNTTDTSTGRIVTMRSTDVLGTTDSASKGNQNLVRSCIDSLGTADIALHVAQLLSRAGADGLGTVDSAIRGGQGVLQVIGSDSLGTADIALLTGISVRIPVASATATVPTPIVSIAVIPGAAMATGTALPPTFKLDVLGATPSAQGIFIFPVPVVGIKRPPLYKNVIRYTGDPGDPQEIKRLRSYTLETARRMGVPVLLKRVYTIYDVNQGAAVTSVNQSSIYRQGRHNDPLSYGTGYVSAENSARGEWMTPTGQLVLSETDPGGGAVEAPLYRGYGPGYLTYAVLPDAPEDVLKYTEEGALVRTQQALVQLPWWPKVGDNDLLIVVQLDTQENIVATGTRYQLKQVQPITMHGIDRMGRKENLGPNLLAGGNSFMIGQQANMNVIPETDPAYLVETDR